MTNPTPPIPPTPPVSPTPAPVPWFMSRLTGPTGGPVEVQAELAGRDGGPIDVRLSGSVDVRVTADAPAAVRAEPTAAPTPGTEGSSAAPAAVRAEPTADPIVEDDAFDDDDDNDDGDDPEFVADDPVGSPIDGAPTASGEITLTFTTYAQTDAAFDEPPPIDCSLFRDGRRTRIADVRAQHGHTLGLTPSHQPWVRGMLVSDDFTPDAGDRVVWKRNAGSKG